MTTRRTLTKLCMRQKWMKMRTFNTPCWLWLPRTWTNVSACFCSLSPCLPQLQAVCKDRKMRCFDQPADLSIIGSVLEHSLLSKIALESSSPEFSHLSSFSTMKLSLYLSWRSNFYGTNTKKFSCSNLSLVQIGLKPLKTWRSIGLSW